MAASSAEVSSVEVSSADSDGVVSAEVASSEAGASEVVSSEVASSEVVSSEEGSSEGWSLVFLPLSISEHSWPAGALTAARSEAAVEMLFRESSMLFCWSLLSFRSPATLAPGTRPAMVTAALKSFKITLVPLPKAPSANLSRPETVFLAPSGLFISTSASALSIRPMAMPWARERSQVTVLSFSPSLTSLAMPSQVLPEILSMKSAGTRSPTTGMISQTVLRIFSPPS